MAGCGPRCNGWVDRWGIRLDEMSQIMKARFIWALASLLLAAGTAGAADRSAKFRTVFGDIDVVLYETEKPKTVANFIRYVESGRYSNSFFHRLDPSFVVQGGGFVVTNRGLSNAFFSAIRTFPAITNEARVGRFYSNTNNTIAMARVGGQTNSATSQWFFNLTNNAFLDNVDGGFTVFGRVLRGFNVLNRLRGFQESRATNGITDLQDDFPQFPFGEIPYLSLNSFGLTNLVYVDITLLDVTVRRLTNNIREISWQSVQGRSNVVLFAPLVTNMNWQGLATNTGTGNRMTVLDTNAAAPGRFYRVRVD
jgi:peptidyl-prolyl cis-trans isomerase A (cyclophilin A)